MGQNSNGLDWLVNVFKKMEGRCLEMCDILEKELLKYAKGQPNSVGSEEDHFQQPHLDVEEDQSPEEHWENQNASFAGALGKAQEGHLVKTENRVRIQSSDKQNYPIIEPNHFSANQEVCGVLKIENTNGIANISRPSRKQSQKAKEIVKFSPSTIQNDEFPDWEII